MAGKGKFTAKNAAEEFITKIDVTEAVEAQTDATIVKPEDSKLTTQKRQTRPTAKGSGYVQRAYYIPDSMFKKIKMLAVEQDRDASSIVREALEEYLENK